MATLCPLCKKHNLKVSKDDKGNAAQIYCEEYKIENVNGEWVNKGACEFRLPLANKIFGMISLEQAKSVIEGKSISNAKGDTLTLDLSSKYFTNIVKKQDDFL